MRIIKPLIIAIAAILSANLSLHAQADSIDTKVKPSVKVDFDARVDFEYKNPSGEKHQSGFYGRYIELNISGDINKHFSYSLNQALNKLGEMRNDVFGATNTLKLNYSPNEHWLFSAGKQVVAIGGFEYDQLPINIFYSSLFWRNIACYQFGISGTYTFKGGNHSLLLQMSNSPLTALNAGCYAYNLMWRGKMGRFSTIWSTNLVEYRKGKFGNYIALGNRYSFNKGYVELDLMNRYMGAGHFLFDDYSIIGKACVNVGRHFDIFAKGGYEHFRPEPEANYTIDKPFYGGGVEYYPLRNSRDLRVHLVADRIHDNSGNGITQVMAGVSWWVNVFSSKK